MPINKSLHEAINQRIDARFPSESKEHVFLKVFFESFNSSEEENVMFTKTVYLPGSLPKDSPDSYQTAANLAIDTALQFYRFAYPNNPADPSSSNSLRFELQKKMLFAPKQEKDPLNFIYELCLKPNSPWYENFLGGIEKVKNQTEKKLEEQFQQSITMAASSSQQPIADSEVKASDSKNEGVMRVSKQQKAKPSAPQTQSAKDRRKLEQAMFGGTAPSGAGPSGQQSAGNNRNKEAQERLRERLRAQLASRSTSAASTEAETKDFETARKVSPQLQKKLAQLRKDDQAEAKRKAAEELKAKDAADQADREARRRAKIEAEAKALAEEEAKRKAEAETKAKTEEEARRKAEEEAMRKADAETKAKTEEEAKRRTAEEAKRKAEAETKAKAEGEARRKAEEEAKRKAEAETKAKTEEEAKRRTAEEAKRKAEAETKAKAEGEARRKAEEEAKRKAEAETKAKTEEEAKRRTADDDDTSSTETSTRTFTTATTATTATPTLTEGSLVLATHLIDHYEALFELAKYSKTEAIDPTLEILRTKIEIFKNKFALITHPEESKADDEDISRRIEDLSQKLDPRSTERQTMRNRIELFSGTKPLTANTQEEIKKEVKAVTGTEEGNILTVSSPLAPGQEHDQAYLIPIKLGTAPGETAAIVPRTVESGHFVCEGHPPKNPMTPAQEKLFIIALIEAERSREVVGPNSPLVFTGFSSSQRRIAMSYCTYKGASEAGYDFDVPPANKELREGMIASKDTDQKTWRELLSSPEAVTIFQNRIPPKGHAEVQTLEEKFEITPAMSPELSALIAARTEHKEAPPTPLLLLQPTPEPKSWVSRIGNFFRRGAPTPSEAIPDPDADPSPSDRDPPPPTI